jgi:hypothetical protein
MNLQQTIGRLSERYGVSAEAVETLAQALERSGGRTVQFNHPDLGGYGQWMPGMIQIGDMFNHRLKARVEGLCNDLSEALSRQKETSKHSASRDEGSHNSFNMEPMKPMKPMEPMKPMKPMQSFEAGKDQWWPKSLGDSPNSAGGQNNIRYAYFADAKRLAVDPGDGKVGVYDTGDHEIHGVQQSQSSGNPSSVVFTSQNGEVKLDSLKRVEG